MIRAIKNPPLRQLLAHYLTARGDKRMPSRRDIDPLQLGPVLPIIWVSVYEPDAGTFRYRLAGEQVNEIWGMSVAGRLLSDFVSTLPSAEIDMALVTRTKSLHLKCAQFEADIRGIDAQDFPLIPSDVTDHKITIPPSTLRQMVEQVTLAAATDNGAASHAWAPGRNDAGSIIPIRGHRCHPRLIYPSLGL